MVRHRVAPKMGKLPAKAKTYISPGFSDNLAGFYSYLVGVFHWAAIGDSYRTLCERDRYVHPTSSVLILNPLSHKTSCTKYVAIFL
jgi:hypothetical protein